MVRSGVVSLLFAAALTLSAASQEIPANEEFAPLVLVRIIPMPAAEGRLDHMAVDQNSGRVFATVFGNDTVEVLDVHRGKQIHILSEGLDEPQGVAFLQSPVISLYPRRHNARLPEGRVAPRGIFLQRERGHGLGERQRRGTAAIRHGGSGCVWRCMAVRPPRPRPARGRPPRMTLRIRPWWPPSPTVARARSSR